MIRDAASASRALFLRPWWSTGGFVKKAGIDQMSPPQLSYCLRFVAAYNAGAGRVVAH